MILPPAFLWVDSNSDGPRMIIGRLWSPLAWYRWQHAVDLSMRRIQATVALAEKAKRVLLISTHHNDAFYLRLRLFEAGYRPVPPDALPHLCRGVSVYGRGDHLIYHVRAEPQYTLGGLSFDDATAIQLISAFRCPDVDVADRTYLTVFGGDPYRLDNAIYDVSIDDFPTPTDIRFPVDIFRQVSEWVFNKKISPQRYGLYDAVPLSHHDVMMMRLKLNEYPNASRNIRDLGGPARSFAQFKRAFNSQYLKAR